MTGILCDFEINTAIAVGNLKIEPFSQENVQPNSYDISIGDTIISDGVKHKLPYTIKHGEFILASTKERVEIKKCICAQVDGKSTTARKGVMVHLTAGFIDCGFRGNITLEMVNFGKDFILEPDMKIGQLIFFESSTPFKPYDGHYQDQEGVTPAWDESEVKEEKKVSQNQSTRVSYSVEVVPTDTGIGVPTPKRQGRPPKRK